MNGILGRAVDMNKRTYVGHLPTSFVGPSLRREPISGQTHFQ